LQFHFGSAQYNCRIYILNRRIILIRPKISLADNGNYREPRYFTAWPRDREMETCILPEALRRVCAEEQTECPFGYAAVRLPSGIKIGSEICEELWTPDSPHIDMALQVCFTFSAHSFACFHCSSLPFFTSLFFPFFHCSFFSFFIFSSSSQRASKSSATPQVLTTNFENWIVA